MKNFALLASLCFALTACGDDVDEPEQEDPVTTFACDGTELICDTAKGELCLYQLFSGSDEHHSQECVVVDPACTSCECATAVAADHFGDAVNCSNAERCSQDNDAFTVGCRNGTP